MSAPPPSRGPRLRTLGVRIGALDTGPENAITDVPGVRVGHVTVWRDEPEGRGVARTGVTAILPGPVEGLFAEPVPAGVGGAQRRRRDDGLRSPLREWGAIETPVYLTATMAVGRVYDGAVAVAVAADPAVGADDVLIPVVAECDDS